MKRFIPLLISVLLLPGCIFMAGAAAGAAGIAMVYDHRKIENILEDQRIVDTIKDKLYHMPDIRYQSHIEVASFNRVVLLVGETPTAELRQRVETVAQEMPNVKRIYNEITVQGPVSALTQASDSWITTKIKTEMLATSGLKSGSIKVITENGTVYLMGLVTHDQADMAVDIARDVSGVQRVMKIFKYTD